jgi:hypothetical protein
MTKQQTVKPVYKFIEGKLEVVDANTFPHDDDSLPEAGFTHEDTLTSDGNREHAIWRNRDNYVVLMDIDPFHWEAVLVIGLPDYLEFKRQILLPVLQCQSYSKD